MSNRPRLSLTTLEDRWTPAAGGTLDPGFGTNGVVPLSLTSLGRQIVAPATVATGADGQVVVFGTLNAPLSSGSADRVVARFTADGRLDTTFGTGCAYVLRNETAPPGGVTVDSSGRVLFVFSHGIGLTRLTADGRPDGSFGVDGRAVGSNGVRPPEGTPLNFPGAVAVQPDGRVVVAGQSGPTLGVSRYAADGQPDLSFGDRGVSQIAVPVNGNNNAYASSVTIQPDGRVAVAGGVLVASFGGKFPSQSYDPLVVRLTPAGLLDLGFGSGGILRIGTPNQSDAAADIRSLPDGRLVLATSTGGVTATRLTADGRTDTSYGSNGQTTQPGYTSAVLDDGRVVIAESVPASTSTTGGTRFRRLTAGGQPDPTLTGDILHVVLTVSVRPAGQVDGGVVAIDTATGSSLFRVLGATNAFPLPAGTVAAGGIADGSFTPLTPTASGLQPTTPVSVYPRFTGNVRAAMADVTGDGVPDTITGPGPGGGPNVIVYDGRTGAKFTDLNAFETGFTGGVFVAAADLNGDGKAEVFVTPDQGGGPVVAIYDGAGLTAGKNETAQLARFFGIVDPDFRGGARAAVGDVNGDGTPDLLVAAGFGGGPRLAVFDGLTATNPALFATEKGAQIRSANGVFRGPFFETFQLPRKLTGDFFVFEDTLRNGVFVAAGDLTGDGAAEVIVGGGPGGGPRVFALDGRDLMAGRQTPVANFFAGDSTSRGGVRVAVRPDAAGRPQLVTGSGDGEAARVRVYKPATARSGGAADQELTPFGGAVLANGVFVG